VERAGPLVLTYTTTSVTALSGSGVRLSPRRSRLLARSLLAARIVTGAESPALFKLVLSCSLPHLAWGARPPAEVVAAAHRLAWDTATASEEAWMHAFLAEPSLPRKVSLLLDAAPRPDAGTKAVSALLAQEGRDRAAAFAFALYPGAALGKLPIGAEGINDLGRLAGPILRVDGEVRWQERLAAGGPTAPGVERFAQVLAQPALTAGRAARARQFFNWCLVEDVIPADALALERDLDGCVEVLRARRLL
jgi:hypothetical protein